MIVKQISPSQICPMQCIAETCVVHERPFQMCQNYAANASMFLLESYIPLHALHFFCPVVIPPGKKTLHLHGFYFIETPAIVSSEQFIEESAVENL